MAKRDLIKLAGLLSEQLKHDKDLSEYDLSLRELSMFVELSRQESLTQAIISAYYAGVAVGNMAKANPLQAK